MNDSSCHAEDSPDTPRSCKRARRLAAFETDLFEIHTHPQFGIGQRVRCGTPEGNILWTVLPCWTQRPRRDPRIGRFRMIAICTRTTTPAWDWRLP